MPGTHFHDYAFVLSQGLRKATGVLIVDDHELVRLGLRALLQARWGTGPVPLQVFEVRSLAAALEVYALNRDQIALVFLDLHLPDAQGLQGVAEFLRRFPRARVAVLSGESDPATMDRALALGADAFLRKSADLEGVLAYLASRDVLPSPAPATSTRAESSPTSGLTPRQQQVLALLLQGRSNKEIAEATELVEGTVKNHVSTLLLHFGARSRSQLISALRPQG